MTDDEKVLLADYWIGSANWLDMFLESHFYAVSRFLDDKEMNSMVPYTIRVLEHLRLDLIEFIAWIQHDCSNLFPDMPEDRLDALQHKERSYLQTEKVLSKVDSLPEGLYRKIDYIKAVYDALEALCTGLGWIHTYGKQIGEPSMDSVPIADRALVFRSMLVNIRKDLEIYLPEALKKDLPRNLLYDNMNVESEVPSTN